MEYLMKKCTLKNASFVYKHIKIGPSFSTSKISLFRRFSTIKSDQVKELEIPLPYGKIAGKAWGSEKGFPVLALHGWLDNCGTFDRLMPLLSDKFYFVTVDSPGHGRSSHMPPGTMYSDISMMLDFKRVTQFLGWEKFHMLGHSLGGSFALQFSAIFPELVEKVMLIDIVKPFSVPVENVPFVKIHGINEVLKIDEKLVQSAPVYTPENAPMRLKKGMHDEIDEEGAKILLKRGTKPSPCGKGLVFSRDLRCKPVELISIRSHDTIKNFMQGLQCELLMILADNRHVRYQPEEPETVQEYVDFYQKHLKKCVIEHMDGNHFIHLNNPEKVAPIINKFLMD